MKKTTFLFAFVALVIANILVYACQKETTTTAVVTMTPATEAIAQDRNVLCDHSKIRIFNGHNLILCGIDQGLNQCSLCGGNYFSANVVGNYAEYAFLNSEVFYICNPTPNTINYSVAFQCAVDPTQKQDFSIPPLTFQIYHLEVGWNGCCIAVPDCN